MKLVGARPKARVALTLAMNRLFAPDLSYELLAGEPLPGDPSAALGPTGAG